MSNITIVMPQQTQLGDDVDRLRDIITPMALRLTGAMEEIGQTTPGSVPTDMIRALSMSLAGFYGTHLNEEGKENPPQAAAELAQQLLNDLSSFLRHQKMKERAAWAAQQPAG